MEGGDTFEDIKDAISRFGGDLKDLPIQVHATTLADY